MVYTNKNLIKEYPTPFYCFDLKAIKSRYAYLKNNLPERVKLCYAIKANPFLAASMQDYIDKYEICSPGELEICMEQELPVNKFVVSGVYKNYNDLKKYISLGVSFDCYTIESLTQYNAIKEITKDLQKPVSVLLRITSSNQFGITKDEAERIIIDAKSNPLITINGLQFYSGTQKTNLSKIQKEVLMLDEFIAYLSDTCDFTVKELEYGPGFPVEYFESGKFDEVEYLKGLSDIINGIKSDAQITLEIGRGLVADCGTFVTSVVDKKNNASGNYAIVDGGIHHISYYGQVMAMKKPYFDIVPNRLNSDKESWNICGSLCTVNDILIKNILVDSLELGDRIIFKNTGAYCVTEGISLFLSRALPSVVLVDENGDVKIAREHTDIYSLNY